MDTIETSTIERDGLTFRVDLHPDPHAAAPWERDDGRGPVSDWRRKDTKRPGELILNTDHGSARFYDFAEAIKIAKQDGWGLGPADLSSLAQSLGREPTKKEIAVVAVQNDFEFLKSWCNDEWSYVGVVVTLLDTEGRKTWENASLWGIESNADEYLKEVALELTDDIMSRVGGAATLCVPIRV